MSASHSGGETSTTQHERGRRYGIRDGALQAVSQGAGESYLSAFALLLQATPFQVGLLSALPQLVGTWAQILSAKILAHVPRSRLLILTATRGQAASWLLLLLLPLSFPAIGPWLLIVCELLYMAITQAGIPALSRLLTDLVPADQRGTYFARQARVMSVVSFCAIGGAGLTLHWAKVWDLPWAGFVVIFLVAAAARATSAGLLARIDEAALPTTRESEFRLLAFLHRERSADFKQFLLFSGLMYFSVMIAGPFFVIYLLRDLHLSYLQYSAWLAAGTAGQFIALTPWGRISDRYGNKKLLVATAGLVPFLPMLYLAGTNFFYLVVVNFLGGVIWAGLLLGLQNYVFDAVRPEDRGKGVAFWNAVNATGWLLGALAGSWLASRMPDAVSLAGIEFRFASNLPLVFFTSGLLRLAVSAALLRTLREHRPVEPISHRGLLRELPLIKPLGDALDARAWRR